MSNGAGGLPVFQNAAARDSQMPVPLVGQACLLKETGELLVWFSAWIGWRPPWNSAWGLAVPEVDLTAPFGIAPVDANSTSFITSHPAQYAVTGLTPTFVPVYARDYEALFDGLVTSGSNGDFVTVAIVVSDHYGIALQHIAAQTVQVQSVGVCPVPVRLRSRFSSSIANVGQPHTVQVIAWQDSGAGGQVYGDGNYASSLVVRDRGPMGPPMYSPGEA